MTTVAHYRAFARECLRWAQRAKNTERREALLELATTWAEAAARVDYQRTLLDQFKTLATNASRMIDAAGANTNIGAKSRRRTELAERFSQADHCRKKASECEKLGLTLSGPAAKALYLDLARQWRDLARKTEMLKRQA